MPRRNCIAMLLAGGKGNRLKNLTLNIAKPAVPFGGKYRIIDFALSNCRNSNIDTVGVLTQYQPHVLHKYIGNGQHWHLDKTDGGLTLLPPFESHNQIRWYEGTAGAIYQNMHFIEQYDPEHVLIISGDHVYKMDYSLMLKQHILTDADVTIAVVNVPLEEASRFGIVKTNKVGKIIEFEEKPAHPKSKLASMGVYIFRRDVLIKYLEDNRISSTKDFGQDIIPAILKDSSSLFAYNFKGYWRDVGTVESFWQANMDLLSSETNIFMEKQEWKIYTANLLHPPIYLDAKGVIMNSLVSEGCNIFGIIKNSVICSGAKIGRNTVIRDSVILPGAEIGDNAFIQKAIVGSNVYIKDRTVIKSEFPNEISLICESDFLKKHKESNPVFFHLT
ncbi:glucose-1-phosphate adenylyltransferase [Neobacillus sp. PS3-34]|uniref:glucose-1-phosphate adenylyltransferase n=1 Tax=Neobacillus sp. PS3-34 TaxID=3070678 RepID=UPI0027E0C1F9|nr:glucose-1-phosphate adenylyltransferase [Neobacillus sp. PS3-34]WML48265.1 glucose-1-phosphate adenylyltransferase [Neobacillus sp. PS3-34]